MIKLWRSCSIKSQGADMLCKFALFYLHFNLQTRSFIINHNHKIAARGAKSILFDAGFSPARISSWCGEMEIFQYRLTSTNAWTGIARAHNVHTAAAVYIKNALAANCIFMPFYKYSEQHRSAWGRSCWDDLYTCASKRRVNLSGLNFLNKTCWSCPLDAPYWI